MRVRLLVAVLKSLSLWVMVKMGTIMVIMIMLTLMLMNMLIVELMGMLYLWGK